MVLINLFSLQYQESKQYFVMHESTVCINITVPALHIKQRDSANEKDIQPKIQCGISKQTEEEFVVLRVFNLNASMCGQEFYALDNHYKWKCCRLQKSGTVSGQEVLSNTLPLQ